MLEAPIRNRIAPVRLAARTAALGLCVLATAVCGEQGRFGGGVTGPGTDTESPVVRIIMPGVPAETALVDLTDSLKFTARATDNSRVLTTRVRIVGQGAFTMDTTVMDTTTTSTVLTVQEDFVIPLPPTAAGQYLVIRIEAADAAGNGARDSVIVAIEDPTPPEVTLRTPSSGTSVPAGGILPVSARASDPSGIRMMGARVFFNNALGQPVAIAGDSEAYAVRSVTRIDTFNIAIPANLTPGTYTVHAFAIDSSTSANDTTTASINVTVADTAAPSGAFTPPFNGAQRVAGDSILVVFRAQDLTGVASVRLRGFSHRGVDSLGTGVDVTRYTEKTATIDSTPTLVTIYRWLNAVLSDSTVEKVYIEAQVTDVGGNTRTVLDSINIVSGPFVRLDAPATGLTHPVGVPLTVTVTGRDPDSLVFLGYQTSGVVTSRDSIAIVPQAENATQSLTFTTTTTTATGSLTVTPFARDKFGNRFTGTSAALVLSDTAKPVVSIALPATAGLPVTIGDSVLVRVQVTDNRGVQSVTLTGVAHRGVDSLGTGVDVQRFGSKTSTMPAPLTSDTTFSRYLIPIASDSTSETVYLVVSARDAAGNSGVDTITVSIVGGPIVEMIRPSDGAQTARGKSLIVEVRAIDPQGVLLIGYDVSGAFTARDSAFFAPVNGNLADTAAFVDTLLVPVGAPLGTLTIVPFALDSASDRSGTNPGVTITVSSTAADSTPPTVSFSIARRVETDDTLIINATDAGGIRRLGFTATLLGGAQLSADSSADDPTAVLSDVTQSFSLSLPVPPAIRFPAQVVVQAFALDSASNRALSVAETLTVVAGKTYPLPVGSVIGDAVFNANRQELYLANTTYDRVEIFSLASASFVAYVPVGSRPSSLSMMPRDTMGNYRDTLIVANSGGTNLSLVDLVNRQELRRHRLPNFQVQTLKTAVNSGGGVDIILTSFEFSDRPFQIAPLCVNYIDASGRCGRVRVVYSTTPTPGQSSPFANRGYLAWSELDTAGTVGLPVHLVYEYSASGRDSLQIIAVRDTMPGQLLRDTILGGGVGRLITISDLPFRENSFVRASGDFLHALVGEGGSVEFARALTYDARPAAFIRDSVFGGACLLVGSALKCDGLRDPGVSDIVQVSDFVTNRSAQVTSVAINYNGRTNLVRADSIYAFDYVLRQTGIMQISAANRAVGMDFHPCNNFDATTRTSTPLVGCAASYTPSERMVFAARPDSSLEVFDTYFYGRVTDTTSTASAIPIPIRNALLGPVRVASVTGQTVLFGFTTQGLVVVNLPTVVNSLFPTPTFTGTSGTPRQPRGRFTP